MSLQRVFEQEARRAGFTVRRVRGVERVPAGLLEEILREVKARRSRAGRNGSRRAANA